MDSIGIGAAILWWIGLAGLFLVVIPLVLVLSRRVLRHLREISDYASDVRAHGIAVTENLAAVPALFETRDLVKDVGARLEQYAGRASRLLRGVRR